MRNPPVSRRKFLQATASGVAAAQLLKPEAFAAPVISVRRTDRPALLGGEPVRSKSFPSWPVVDARDEEIWTRVLHEKAWCELNGSQVAAFEEEYQAAMGEGHVVATANGTSALHACLYALDVGPGDEVLMPAHTFVATMQAILGLYALPVFVDVDPQTGMMDPEKLEEKISENTRVILPVHLGGAAADMDGIMRAAARHRLHVLEDACQSPFSEWDGKKLGLVGDCGAISFQVTKILPSGEGGAVVTRSPDLRTLVHAFRNNGRDPERKVSNFPYMGLNFRMTEFQGALLRTQLAKFEEQSSTRRRNVAYFNRGLEQIGGLTPTYTYPKNTRRNYYYYALHYHSEQFAGLSIDRFVEAMRAEGIPISGSSRAEILTTSPSIDRVLNSRGFRKIYSGAHLRRCRESLDCPVAQQFVRERVVLRQSMLLGTQQDMDDILAAVEKIRQNASSLA